MVISTEIRKINNNLRHQCTNFDLLSLWFIASLLRILCCHLYLFLSGSFKILRADRLTNSQSRNFEFFNQSKWQWVCLFCVYLIGWNICENSEFGIRNSWNSVVSSSLVLNLKLKQRIMTWTSQVPMYYISVT